MSGRDFVPHEYQGMITDHILQVPRAGVWAGMGVGKTISTYNALDVEQAVDDQPVLVLAPLRVARSTWPEEARKWQHLRHLHVLPVVGSERERISALKQDANVYTTNFENLPWLVEYYEKARKAWPFARVVVDESTKLKGFRLRQGTQRAKALAKVAHTQVKRIVELTGTPAPNGLTDLWGQAWFLDKGHRLGRTYEDFKMRWFEKDYNGTIKPRNYAQEQIQRALKDLCITIEAKDWFDLREPIETNIYVDLPARARALYEDMEKRMFMELSGHEVEAFNAAARTIKCLQVACGFAYVDEGEAWQPIHDVKIDALEEIVEEACGMPVLVAYHFRPDLERLLKAFPAGRALDQDPQTIKDWNAGKIPVLFAHPASAGHGLNLQDGGNILVYYGHWWNLEERMQIFERIGPTRQLQAGHDRSMFVYNIIARDTVDELVIERTKSKREVQDILLDAMKVRGYR